MELMMELLFKIGSTALVVFIVVLIADSLCEAAHKDEKENKDIKYKSPILIGALGVCSFFVMWLCCLSYLSGHLVITQRLLKSTRFGGFSYWRINERY